MHHNIYCGLKSKKPNKQKTPPVIIAHIFSIPNHYSTYNKCTTIVECGYRNQQHNIYYAHKNIHRKYHREKTQYSMEIQEKSAWFFTFRGLFF